MKKRKKNALLILSLFFVCSNLFSQTISYPDSSVLAHGDWYKFSIPSSGLYLEPHQTVGEMAHVAESQ